MPKLLQINTVVNRGSTGRICEEIGLMAQSKGWDSYIAYGKRKPTSKNHLIRIQGKWGFYWHVLMSRLFGLHGYSSYFATKRLVKKIKELDPDVIHLHNLHGYYLHIPTLFKYLRDCGKPVVWTLHDCWAVTGHCSHFVSANCNKWKTGCEKCPLYKGYPDSWFFDRSKKNWLLKRELFTAVPNLHIIPVSRWLEGIIRETFLKDKDIQVINNGVDLTVFKPAEKFKISDKFRILGVASVWTSTKGLEDFKRLRQLLDEEFEIVLVGLSEEQMNHLPKGIVGISRTNSKLELVKLYSESDVFVNLTYADTFPTVNIEALACGTSVVTYRTGGSPEIIDNNSGIVVEQGDVAGVAKSIRQIQEGIFTFKKEDCKSRAQKYYNKTDNYKKYIDLYKLTRGKFLILSIASTWSDAKGLSDYNKLSKKLQPDEILMLVGLTEQQIEALPHNIIGLTRTESKEDLAALYRMASVVTSFSYGESFGLTIIEAAACVAHVVAFENTGQSELIKDVNGLMVSTGDVDAAYKAIHDVINKNVNVSTVMERYDIKEKYKEYIQLYEDIYNNNLL